MNEIQKEKCRKIVDNYGYKLQCEVLVEECAELIQAVQKLKRVTDPFEKSRCIYQLREEIADVSIMIEQMKFLFGEERINELIGQKLDRQLTRMEQKNE